MENMTAKVSCFARAYHYENNPIHVFADPYAKQLLGEDYGRIARSMSQGIRYFFPDYRGNAEDGLRQIVDKHLSPSVLGRSAYCENKLYNEKRLGCHQYLILASGYDSFAIRNSDVGITVYELDLPELLSDKKKRIDIAELKSNAVFVPCDLSNDIWKDKLTESGFQRNKKSFGSLLGISYYLEKYDFRNLLMSLSSIMFQGSAICFDYPTIKESREMQSNQALANGAGEKMKAQYDSREMETMLEECGFYVYEHLNHDEMTDRFFSEYNNCVHKHRLEAPEGVCYILAVRRI